MNDNFTSPLGEEKSILIPTFEYYPFGGGNTTAVEILLLGEQLEISKRQQDGVTYYELTKHPDPRSEWSFDEIVNFLIETNTPFLISDYGVFTWHYCYLTEKDRAVDGLFLPQSAVNIGYSIPLPYRTVNLNDKQKFNAVQLPFNYYEKNDFYRALGFEEAVFLPYRYDLSNNCLTVETAFPHDCKSFFRTSLRTQEEKDFKSSFAKAEEIQHYKIEPRKDYQKLVVLENEERWGVWRVSIKIPYKYYRLKKVLKVLNGVSNDRYPGWEAPECLPFTFKGEDKSLEVKENIIGYGWAVAVAVEPRLINGKPLYPSKCLEDYHLNITQLRKRKKYKQAGQPSLEIVGYYTSSDSHYTKVAFYDARDYLDEDEKQTPTINVEN